MPRALDDAQARRGDAHLPIVIAAVGTIGRALRLCLLSIGGGAPGEVDKTILGMPGKCTFCLRAGARSTHARAALSRRAGAGCRLAVWLRAPGRPPWS
jgi:hypothetical protein